MHIRATAAASAVVQAPLTRRVMLDDRLPKQAGVSVGYAPDAAVERLRGYFSGSDAPSVLLRALLLVKRPRRRRTTLFPKIFGMQLLRCMVLIRYAYVAQSLFGGLGGLKDSLLDQPTSHWLQLLSTMSIRPLLDSDPQAASPALTFPHHLFQWEPR